MRRFGDDFISLLKDVLVASFRSGKSLYKDKYE